MGKIDLGVKMDETFLTQFSKDPTGMRFFARQTFNRVP